MMHASAMIDTRDEKATGAKPTAIAGSRVNRRMAG
jgi:hypothetical protein